MCLISLLKLVTNFPGVTLDPNVIISQNGLVQIGFGLGPAQNGPTQPRMGIQLSPSLQCKINYMVRRLPVFAYLLIAPIVTL